MKYIIKFLQSYDNNKRKNSPFIISRNTCKKLAEHRLRTSALYYYNSIEKYAIRQERERERDSLVNR